MADLPSRLSRVARVVASMRTVIVTGGRNYQRTDLVWAALDYLQPGVRLVGGAPGADRAAREWARARGVRLFVFEADWYEYGRAAGPMRNREMVSRACMLRGNGREVIPIRFPGGRGTYDCVKQLTAADFEVLDGEAVPGYAGRIP